MKKRIVSISFMVISASQPTLAQAPTLNRSFEPENSKVRDWSVPIEIGEFVFKESQGKAGCVKYFYFGVETTTNRKIDWETDSGYNNAVKALGELVEEECLSTSAVLVKYSLLTTRITKDQDWYPTAVYNKKLREYHRETETYMAAPQFAAEPSNPLSERGYYAARKMGEAGNMTLYEAYPSEITYQTGYRSLQHIIVHDVADDEELFGIKSSAFSFDVSFEDEFIDDLNELLRQADNKFAFLSGMRFHHYVEALSLPRLPETGARYHLLSGVEEPFVTTQFEESGQGRIREVTQLRPDRGIKTFAPDFTYSFGEPRSQTTYLTISSMLKGETPVTVAALRDGSE